MTEEHKIVIPGEVISTTEGTLPGEGTEKRGDKIVSLRYGLLEDSNNLAKVIPLSGVFVPRRGNVVIGAVENVLFNGWLFDVKIGASSFLPVSEYPRYVEKNMLTEVMKIGDLAVLKIQSVNQRGVDLTMRYRGLNKIDKGITIEINPNKVPRVIGKEGSMVSLIKEESGCEITVGQNGVIWISGESIEKELLAKKAINYVAANSLVSGLTEKVKEFFQKEKEGKK